MPAPRIDLRSKADQLFKQLGDILLDDPSYRPEVVKRIARLATAIAAAEERVG